MHSTRNNVRVPPGITIDSVSIKTEADPHDLSVTAQLELKATAHILEEVRGQLSQKTRNFGSPHGVEATVGGKEVLHALLTRFAGADTVTFPADWDIDVEVREHWPQKKGVLVLDLNSSQDPDALAQLLGMVGINHDYDNK